MPLENPTTAARGPADITIARITQVAARLK
jgi:hypothetical protein